MGLAFEHGSGVLMARLPAHHGGGGDGTQLSKAGGGVQQRIWSAPCFMHIDGLSSGLTAGVHKAEHVIGVMTDRSRARAARMGAAC